MPSASDLHESLQTIADRVSDDMSERDVENLFLETGFYDALGYEGTGTDIRSEFTLPDDKRPDYITLDSDESVSVVYEFKKPSRELPKHEPQLFDYVDQLSAEYGVLTNGIEIRIYQQDQDRYLSPQSLDDIDERVVRDIADALQKRAYDLTDPDDVTALLNPDPIELDGGSELGQEYFFDTFRLEEGSPFANLVVGLMDVLSELRDESDEKAEEFVQGAYDFWEATYASEPDEIPNSWEPFIDGKQSLRDFMFSLETGHALLARLLLAKATEDHDFFGGTAYNGMDDYFHGLEGFGDTINLDAFPIAANNLIDDMQEQLVEALFQDDIFVWWTEGYREQIGRRHETGANQVNAIINEESGVELLTDATRDRFSRSVAQIFFNILRFDFKNIEGDLLGDLYQRYFDPETRKALGEFYTPEPVVDYIMDGVDYDRGVSNERLMDPACGSGTFLVEAVERYLNDVERYATGEPDWETRLRELCTQPHVVGLDIHPFAVLMAQIRFVVAILPKYKEAKNQNRDFTLRRLPIYRTDTLRNERELTGVDIGDDDAKQMTFDAMTEDDQDVLIPVPLPVEVEEDEAAETEDGFLVRRVRMPLFDTIKLNTGVQNFGEYFAALQGVLDTVKDHIALSEPGQLGSEYDWMYHSGLEKRINRYTSQEYEDVEDFFEPYVNDMLENVRYLKEEHNDGRLFKMLEDAVLALVVKNYMSYDYVVGNPPYVRTQHLPDSQKMMMNRLYESATGNYDIYCPFYERGLDWLHEDTGKLGYITPNQFMNTDYGEGLRRVMLRDSRIEEVYDFRDSGVFEDATNYPAIVIIEDEADKSQREDNEIRCVRVKANTDEESGRELDEEIITSVRENRGDPGYSDNFIDVFDYPQGRLSGEEYWALMPPEELHVFEKLEREADTTIGDVTDAVFQGIRTSANKIYVVDVLDSGRVESDDTGDIVTVVPTGGSEEYEIETDLLRPFLAGDEVSRWRGDWGGLHVIHPYYAEKSEDGELNVGLYSSDYLKENLPETWNYFLDYRDSLESRESGRKRGEDDWYGYIYPKNLDKFEKPKIIQAEIAEEATYLIDEVGTWYFTTGYGVSLTSQHLSQTTEIASQLNSKALDFYIKHIAAIKAGGFYSYRTQYVEKLPCVVNDSSNNTDLIRGKANTIVDIIDLDSGTERFPEAYLGDYDGELDYITYEWQTRRYPVNAEVQSDVDGDFTVQAGRSDKIADPAMYSDDREARKLRAEYVHATVDGRNVKSGEEMTIPIPRSDDGVEALLNQLEEDQETVEETDIDALEAEIDEAVYDLFDLTEDEQQVIEDYLEVF